MRAYLCRRRLWRWRRCDRGSSWGQSVWTSLPPSAAVDTTEFRRIRLPPPPRACHVVCPPMTLYAPVVNWPVSKKKKKTNREVLYVCMCILSIISSHSIVTFWCYMNKAHTWHVDRMYFGAFWKQVTTTLKARSGGGLTAAATRCRPYRPLMKWVMWQRVCDTEVIRNTLVSLCAYDVAAVKNNQVKNDTSNHLET